MSVFPVGPVRARVPRARARDTRARLAGALVAVVAVLAAAVPAAGAATARRGDALGDLARAWQRDRTGVALAGVGLIGARAQLAVAGDAAAALARAQEALRIARHFDPAADLGGPRALGAALDLASAVRARAAAIERDRSVALYAAVVRAAATEALLAHEVARRGRVDETRLREEWGRAPARAIDAMAFALAQSGKPYVYAASGPAGYDCSGLTMAAWGRVGVHLTHFAAAQHRETARVPAEDLAPGDLVFFGSDLGHVGLYLGQHLMVHAPHTGDVVRVTSVTRRGGVRTGRVRG